MRYTCFFLLLLATAPSVFALTGDNLTLNLDGRWANGPCRAVDSVGPVAYFGDGAHLRIVDYSGPSPVELGDILLPGVIGDVDVVGSFAYVANYLDGLRIVDISDPSAPTEVGSSAVSSPAIEVAVFGTHAYLSTQLTGLRVIDISNPAAPLEVGSIVPANDAVQAIAAFGDYVYSTSSGADVLAIDVSNPTMPVIVGRYDYSEPGNGIATDGDHVFVAHNHIINVLDFSVPNAPVRTRAVALPPGIFATAVDIDGNDLFVAEVAPATLGRFQIFDWDPVTTGLVSVSTAPTRSSAVAVAGGGGFAFVGDDDEGLVALDVSNLAVPVEIGRYDTAGQIYGAAVKDNLVYLSDAQRGLHIIDAAQSPPTRIGHLQTADTPNRVVVQGDHAYIAAQGAGLIIVDVSDPTNPVEVSTVGTSPSALGVAVVGNLAYLSSSSAGLQIFDIGDPTAPTLTAYHVPASGYGRMVAANATHAFLAKGSKGISSIDVSDPFNPVEVDDHDFVDVFGKAWDVALAGDYLYVADEGVSRLRIIDVSDPTDIGEVTSYPTPGRAHGVAVGGGYLYVAINEAGILMYDLVDPALPAQVGYFDTGHRAFSVAASATTVVVADHEDGAWLLGNGTATSSPERLPATSYWSLAAARPNPFNPRTEIPIHLATSGSVELTIHDVRGALVTTLHVGFLNAGTHMLPWNGRDDAGRPVGSGLYMARAQAHGEVQSVKLTLVR